MKPSTAPGVSPSSFRLDGLSTLITGAGSGMGRAMATAFAAAGAAHVFLCGRRRDKLEETAAALAATSPECRAHVLPVDIGSPEDRQRALNSVRQSAQHLDVLVHNAGLFDGATLEETSDDVARAIHAINVEAPLAWTRDALPLFAGRAGANVITISSTLAVKPIPVAAAYNAAKAGLLQLTRSLALELAPRGIRVNCILPAIVDTPMYRGRYGDDADYQQGLVAAGKLHPLGRIGRAEDIAGAALFLASPAASWITGVGLPVDGGMLCT